ncbi:MAG: hypothetical protein HYY84_05020 [Deltaproteobacteria bacterium]|nr:hypothetical protein [Deltaproteobacteria bacterium]
MKAWSVFAVLGLLAGSFVAVEESQGACPSSCQNKCVYASNAYRCRSGTLYRTYCNACACSGYSRTSIGICRNVTRNYSQSCGACPTTQSLVCSNRTVYKNRCMAERCPAISPYIVGTCRDV